MRPQLFAAQAYIAKTQLMKRRMIFRAHQQERVYYTWILDSKKQLEGAPFGNHDYAQLHTFSEQLTSEA